MTDKKILRVGIAGVVCGICLYGWYHSTHSIQMKNRTIELGTKTALLYDVKDWVKEGKDVSDLQVAIMQKDKMYREYLEVGTYDVKLVDSNQNQRAQGKLIIEDTAIPEWDKTTDQIVLNVGDKLNLKDYFHAKDYAKVKYSTKDKIDTSVQGKTKTMVYATDASGNYNQFECTFVVQ